MKIKDKMEKDTDIETVEYIKLILNFMSKAGKIACEYQKKIKEQSSFELKEDKTLVTKADKKISKLFKETIQYLLNKGHCLIDEENVKIFGDVLKKFNEAKYTWVIDPIDGTEPYARGCSEWGVAVSLYENKKPSLGFIYVPNLKELIYCNKNSAYIVDTSKKNWEMEQLKPFSGKKPNVRYKIFGHNHSNRGTVNFDNSKVNVYDYHTACIYAFKTFLGEADGFAICSRSSIWDIASAIPIAQRMGLKVYNIANKKIFNELHLEKMSKENWRLKVPVLFCHPEHSKELLDVITLKKENYPELFKKEPEFQQNEIISEENIAQFSPCGIF
jgi:myo-inositol-1(or 4)-monophosphatase